MLITSCLFFSSLEEWDNESSSHPWVFIKRALKGAEEALNPTKCRFQTQPKVGPRRVVIWPVRRLCPRYRQHQWEAEVPWDD